MVRGISSYNSNSFNNLMLGGKTKAKELAKHVDLPSKIALSAMGIFGTSKVIGDKISGDIFEMKCSDYDSSTDTDTCHSDFWCGLTFP